MSRNSNAFCGLESELTKEYLADMADLGFDFDEEFHPLLQFDTAAHRTRFQSFIGKDIIPVSSVSWTAMHSLGIAERLQHLLFHGPQSTARPPAFLRLLDIDEVVYQELTLEFLTTVDFVHRCTDYSRDDMLRFRLGGIDRSLSLRQFATTMGIYTPEEVADASFDTAVLPQPRMDHEAQARTWAQLVLPAAGPYDPHRSKATVFRDPVHRILFRVIATTIACRRDPGTVAVRDLELIRLFLDRDCVMQVAYIVASFLSTAGGQRASSPILGGMYITRLARGLGVLDDADLLAGLTEVPGAARTLIGLDTLDSMRMLTADRRHLLGMPVAGAEHVEEVHEPDHPPIPPPPPPPHQPFSTPGASSSHSQPSAPDFPHTFTSTSAPESLAMALEMLDHRRMFAHLAQLLGSSLPTTSPYISVDLPSAPHEPHPSPQRPTTDTPPVQPTRASPSTISYSRRVRPRRDAPQPPPTDA